MNNEIILDITDLSYEGKGIARKDNLVYFVENALDTETVQAQVIENKSRYARAKAIKILNPSPDRVVSECKVYPKCGGCSLRHMSYERQLRLKKETVLSNLRRIGHLEIDDIKIFPNPLPNGYRNKAEYKVSNNLIGFYEDNSHRIVPHDKCLLVDDTINDIKNIIKNYLTSDISTVTIKKADEGYMVIIESEKDLPENLLEALKNFRPVVSIIQNSSVEARLIYGKPYITDNLCGLEFQISADSFYQVNKIQTEKLYSIAKQFLLDSASKEDLKEKTLLDLYCGIGTVGLYMADSVKYVIGVEIGKSAIENARDNTLINSITNAEFICADAKDAIEQIDYNILVADPPRKGLDEKVIRAIRDKQPETIIFISCNSSTLARDIGLLSDLYQIKDIAAVDMFTHTSHVETVVLITRVNK